MPVPASVSGTGLDRWLVGDLVQMTGTVGLGWQTPDRVNCSVSEQ